MNYEEVQRQLLGLWRGRRSQAALSRRLGYQSNVVFEWESGRRDPSAAKAFQLARSTGVDVVAALRRFTRLPLDELCPKALETQSGVAQLMSSFRGSATLVSLAKSLGCSRYTVGRWLGGQTSPSLAEFLHYIEVTTLRLLDLISEIVDPKRIPAIKENWERLMVARNLAYELPWSHAVLRVLELRSYQEQEHPEVGFIARRLGISINEEKQCLELLESTGQISRKGCHFQVIEAGTIDTRYDAQRSRELRAFWSDLGASRIRGGEEGVFAFNLFGVSKKDLKRLKWLQREYFAELRRIVASSEPVEAVVLTNIHLFTLAE